MAALASLFVHEIVERCTHGIDPHTGALHRDNFPQIRTDLNESEETETLAKAFSASVILNSDVRDGSLRAIAAEHKIPLLVYEAGEALRYDALSIRIGLRVMRQLGMIR